MSKGLSEEDFATLRTPFESGRQSPSNLGKLLLFSAPFQALLFVLIYYTIGYDTTYPYRDQIYSVHIIITSIIIILSIIYGFSSVYMRGQKMQYFISILISQCMFGVNFFLGALYLLGSSNMFNLEEAIIIRVTYILLITGMLIIIITCVRFYRLLHQGEYRAGSNKDMWRTKFEKKQLLVPLVIVGTSISLMIQSLNKSLRTVDVDVLMLLITGPLLFFTMLFILPEQMMLLYCKFRFKSFNYDKDGNLMLPANKEDIEDEL